MSQSQEKIAAVVVTYNRKDLLGQCLDSLLRQSHPLDALYIIDNHSTDGTYESLLGRSLIAPAEARGHETVETNRPVRHAGRAGGWKSTTSGCRRTPAARAASTRA